MTNHHLTSQSRTDFRLMLLHFQIMFQRISHIQMFGMDAPSIESDFTGKFTDHLPFFRRDPVNMGKLQGTDQTGITFIFFQYTLIGIERINSGHAVIIRIDHIASNATFHKLFLCLRFLDNLKPFFLIVKKEKSEYIIMSFNLYLFIDY